MLCYAKVGRWAADNDIDDGVGWSADRQAVLI
jgi:hypothetical protein